MHGNKWLALLISLMIMLLCAGVALMLYPYIYGAIVDHEITLNAEDFLIRVEPPEVNTIPIQTIPEQEIQWEPVTVPVVLPVESTPPTEAREEPYESLRYAMETYNRTIFQQGQSGLSCEYDYQKPSFSLSEYGIQDEIFGVITIPAMNLEMPIYLGATYQHMADGAAHLSQTSLPIGGENTNCVIAGHRGWRGASYFRYIEKLRIGDEVRITNFWETLYYKVVDIQIIAPYEVERILIQEGRDLITLLTCHPYASGGKQRYLVFCERVVLPEQT